MERMQLTKLRLQFYTQQADLATSADEKKLRQRPPAIPAAFVSPHAHLLSPDSLSLQLEVILLISQSIHTVLTTPPQVDICVPRQPLHSSENFSLNGSALLLAMSSR
jgi:hypothetical protein